MFKKQFSEVEDACALAQAGLDKDFGINACRRNWSVE
jgi:hypothetical protein